MQTLPERSRPPIAQTLLEFGRVPGAIETLYDVVIVGTGYGGSVAAGLLAGASVTDPGASASRPLKVLVLERGREFLPEDFPSTFGELPGELRVCRQNTGGVSRHTGLFDLRLGEDVNALVANGLGGGSLINAGVMLEPDPDQLADVNFAAEVRQLISDGYYEQARRWLGADVFRNGRWQHNGIDRAGRFPLKVSAMADLAEGLRAPRMPAITVAFDDQPNFAGERLNACVHCGDCMTGCTIGAKDSLDRNLLSLAGRRGALLVTQATVTSLVRSDNGVNWILRVAHADPFLQLREDYVLRLSASHVILAAGTLGSTEILMRSREDDLFFSPRLGERFSCNGDNIGAVRGLQRTNGTADEDIAKDQREVGPTITTAIPMTGLRGAGSISSAAARPFWLQEFSVPGPLKQVFTETVLTARTIRELPAGDDAVHKRSDEDPLAVNSQSMDRTLVVGVIGHDDAKGSLRLANPSRGSTNVSTMGALRIHWPQARNGIDLDDAQRAVEDLAGRQPGRSAVANPMWRLLPDGLAELVSQPRGPVLTVHPLGGCPMGTSADAAVVDRMGIVFNPRGPERWQGSLLVVDGSIVPCSLGANPALTISAFASRAVADLIARAGWQSSGSEPLMRRSRAPDSPDVAPVLPPELPRPVSPLRQPPPPSAAPERTQIRITERLAGPIKTEDGREFQAELTLGFEPRFIAQLIAAERLPVRVEQNRSRLRIFRRADWDAHHLRALEDRERDPFVVFEAEISGELRFLHRAPSTKWRRVLRALWAWAPNRGIRDLYQRYVAPGDARAARVASVRPLSFGAAQEALGEIIRIASRAGEMRLFDYDMALGRVLFRKAGEAPEDWKEGKAIKGEKHVIYDRRANPWRQLTRMHVTAFPALRTNAPGPRLDLDTRFIGKQRAPLLQITRQRHQAEALAELLGFGLYLFRILVSIHLWTFRKPDTPTVAERERQPQRMPGVIAGLPEPEVTELIVGEWPPESPRAGQPLKIRLTRYPNPSSKEHPPLVFLHGYSVSGNTFTHPSLGSTSAAAWFWKTWRDKEGRDKKGRDIWVVELRTSTALDSATWPWAMEDAALVDLPAALLFVRNATGFAPDVFAHCIGCVMLSMAILGDAADVRSGKQQLGVATFLTSEQLGTLAAFNGPTRKAGEPHPNVRRIVLSQKGPVLRYTNDNVMRAAIMQYVRRWLLADDYQFRASADASVSEQLLDRLLSSLPYPDRDYDVENPLRPCVRTPWVGTRHRMDALYGRDFNADNMEPDVLMAIDDLFGAINLDTVSQTIHFALYDSISNQRGRGEFVTQNRLRERWSGISTYSVSGHDNGLADRYTQTLLSRHLSSAGIDLQSEVLDPGVGHQDVLIGRSRVDVFERVERYLASNRRTAGPVTRGKLIVDVPWVGPRLVAPGQVAFAGGAQPLFNTAPGVGVMSRPDRGVVTLWLVPVRRQPGVPGWARVSTSEIGRWPKQLGHSDKWIHSYPIVAADVDWLALLVYEPGEVPAMVPIYSGPQILLGPTRPLIEAVDNWLVQADTDTIDSVLVLRQDLIRVRDSYQTADQAPPAEFCFALGSCQYPSGLFDEGPAGQCLLGALPKDVEAPPHLMLLVGDQIYADATAGLVDPTRSDELYQVPHERALRLPAMRRVMRRMPTHMLLDDHELFDNWEPLPPAPENAHNLQSRGARARREELREARKSGLRAFLKYQRMDQALVPAASADNDFQCAGHAFFLLDTRTQRERGQPLGDQATGHILHEHQRIRLQNWLKGNKGRVKFIATPSVLLPRRELSARTSPSRPASMGANTPASDAWCGFPASMHWLLRFLHEEGIGKTIFLSGDEHHSFVSVARLTGGGRADQEIISVHSSGLYAPFPFANGRPSDLRGTEAFDLPGNQTIRVSVQTKAPDRGGDGIAVLRLNGGPEAPHLSVEFISSDGSSRGDWSSDLR